MMTPLVLGLGVPELLIILAVVLLLFGGEVLRGFSFALVAQPWHDDAVPSLALHLIR